MSFAVEIECIANTTEPIIIWLLQSIYYIETLSIKALHSASVWNQVMLQFTPKAVVVISTDLSLLGTGRRG